jgi:hypothetical protein
MQPRAQQRRRTERPAINGAACVPRPSGAVRRERFEGPLLARLERDAAAPLSSLVRWRRPVDGVAPSSPPSRRGDAGRSYSGRVARSIYAASRRVPPRVT